MPRRDFKLRARDILEAIEKIARYTEGMDLEAFGADERTVDAVVRNITIIGEAARHVPDEVMAARPDIPWPQMRRIRNIVVHEYFGVSLPILWETIRGDLPPLVKALKGLLADEGL